MQVIYKIICEV